MFDNRLRNNVRRLKRYRRRSEVKVQAGTKFKHSKLNSINFFSMTLLCLQITILQSTLTSDTFVTSASYINILKIMCQNLSLKLQ